MTSVQLFSGVLTVTVNSHGAEICSVKNQSGFEYIWQADKTVWARHAPVLFPIVGKLKDNFFIYEGKKFELPQHGFARDMPFELISQTANCCTFQLVSSVETDMKYPFDFVFRITHELNQSTLITKYQIRNLFARDMYVSVGAHPGFNCFEGSKIEDHYIEFERDGLTQTRLHDGLLSEVKLPFPLHERRLNLSKDLFDNDALVFEDNQINKLSLCSKTSGSRVVMECKDWPYFGIWSKKGCDRFVCLEPWYGITDSVNSSQQISEKKGIIHLRHSQEFNCEFSVSFL